MSTAKTIFSCTLVAAAGVAAIWLLNRFKAEPDHSRPEVPPRVVRSLLVDSIDKRIDVTTQGTVQPLTEIDLIAQVSGVVRSISPSLRSGGFFDKDEVLVQIDDRDYELEVTRAEAVVAQAALRLSLEQAEAEVARQEWERIGKGKATPLTLREPQVLEAKAGLAAAEAVLGIAKLALERTRIRAPYAGRVRRQSVDVGQYVAPGTALAKVYSVGSAEVRLPLHDSKLRYLDLPLSFQADPDPAAGTPVTLQARFAQQLQEWSGRIVRTEGAVDEKNRMVYAIARVADPYRRDADRDRLPLAPGMFVTATIHGRVFRGVIEIPRDAVRGDSDVFVIDEQMRMHRRPVGLLHRGETTVIVDQGLKAGERICLSPIGVFVEGMPVELHRGVAEPAGKMAGNAAEKAALGAPGASGR